MKTPLIFVASMKRVLLLSVALTLSAGLAWAGETLNGVKSSKNIRCGVSTGITGFSEQGQDGRWSGIDVDFCRAVSAAVLGDPERVTFKPLPTLARFTALMSGEIDILARNATWTLGREATLGIVFTGPLVYSTQGVLVSSQSGIKHIAELNNSKICVVRDSTQDATLNYWARRKGLQIEKIAFESDDLARENFFQGTCQGYASDGVLLASMSTKAPGGREAYHIITDDLTMDPISPAVRQKDHEWRMLVETVWASLLLAEEFGLNQADFMPNAPSSQEKEVFLSKTASLAKALGLEPGWAAQVIIAVGNYGEMFQRNLGSQSGLKLERGPNRLWSQGGLMIPPDF